MEIGDTITIDGCYAMVRNKDRKWWQFWKPREVASTDLAQWSVKTVGASRVNPEFIERLRDHDK